MTVILVEGKTVEQLVENLKKGKYKSEEDIRAKSMLFYWLAVMIFTHRLFFFIVARDISADDEIVAGLQKMSLKCPVSLWWL